MDHQNTSKHTDQPMALRQWAIRTQTNAQTNPRRRENETIRPRTNTQTNPWRHDNEPSEHKQTHRPTDGVVTNSHQNTNRHIDQPMASCHWAIRTQTDTQTNRWRITMSHQNKIKHRLTYRVVTLSHQSTSKHQINPWRRDNEPLTHKQTHRPTHGIMIISHQNTSKHTDQHMTS